jgi:cytochrome b6-f complex iron-sulfur subunit
MNARGLRRYIDDLLDGRRPRPFDADGFEAAQIRTAIQLRAADRHGGSAAPGPLLRRNKPPPAVTVLRTEPGIGGGESSSLAR